MTLMIQPTKKFTFTADTTRHYQTRAGQKVTIRQTVLTKSLGENTTFPVKGSIQRQGVVRKLNRCQIWQINGKASIWGKHRDDIVGYWEE